MKFKYQKLKGEEKVLPLVIITIFFAIFVMLNYLSNPTIADFNNRINTEPSGDNSYQSFSFGLGSTIAEMFLVMPIITLTFIFYKLLSFIVDVFYSIYKSFLVEVFIKKVQ